MYNKPRLVFPPGYPVFVAMFKKEVRQDIHRKEAAGPSDFSAPFMIRAFRKLACFSRLRHAHGAKTMLKKSLGFTPCFFLLDIPASDLLLKYWQRAVSYGLWL